MSVTQHSYSHTLVPRLSPISGFDCLPYVMLMMTSYTQALPGYNYASVPTIATPNICQYRNTEGSQGLGMRLDEQSKQSKTGDGESSRNEIQQYVNLARITTAKRWHFHLGFQFPVSVSSFHFISISCFSICQAMQVYMSNTDLFHQKAWSKPPVITFYYQRAMYE